MTAVSRRFPQRKKTKKNRLNTAVAKLEQFLLERRGTYAAQWTISNERELHSLFATERRK